VWLGPKSDEKVQEDFMSFFRRTRLLDGDVYMQASHDEIVAYIKQKAHMRNKHLDPLYDDEEMVSILPFLLPPDAQRRFGEHKTAYEAFAAENPGKPYFSDLDHNVGMGPMSGSIFPTADTHPEIFSFGHGRLACPGEVLSSQGVDVYPALSGGRSQSKVASSILKLPAKEIMHLAGNAVHIPTCTAWMLYVLTHLRRVEDMYKPSHMITIADLEVDEDE